MHRIFREVGAYLHLFFFSLFPISRLGLFIYHEIAHPPHPPSFSFSAIAADPSSRR